MINITKYKLEIIGDTTLIMHSCQMVNPLHPLTRQIKPFTSKRNKTEEDYIKISKLEFQGGCYWDAETGFYIPSENIEASIVKGASVNKNGPKAKLAVRISEHKIKLIHDAKAKTPLELYEEDNGKYQDIRFVVVNGKSRVMRCRPRFDRWSLSCTLELDTANMTEDDLITAIQNAGSRCGLGDMRPNKGGKYGAFVAKLDRIIG